MKVRPNKGEGKLEYGGDDTDEYRDVLPLQFDNAPLDSNLETVVEPQLDPFFCDSDFENSDEDKFYFPRSHNDPTKSLDDFQGDAMNSIHVDSSDSEDSEFSTWSSEDEDCDTLGRVKKKQTIEFNPSVDMVNPAFKLGMVFPTVKLLREAIKVYQIKTHRAIWFEKNDKVRVRVACQVGCPFTLYASIVPDSPSFMIKTLNDEHKCLLEFSTRCVTAKWLSEKYLNKWRAQPNWTYSGFKEQVKEDFQVDVSKWQFYRAKKWASNKISGSVKEQYNRLWDYCEEILTSNPGSTVKLECEPILDAESKDNPKFMRIYVCMGACKKGFLVGCRPIIGLDGCFVKGPHKGQLLAAVGIDPNNAIYPIAYAVVESECFETWKWFLGLLIDDLAIHSNWITWISDRQKGLIEAVKYYFGENPPHRFCVRHLYNNFKIDHKGLLLKQILWAAAKATTKPKFQAEMERIKSFNIAAWEWLARKDPKQWSKSHFNDFPTCDILLNNLCESFNGAIVDARDKPIITLVEMVRCYIMRRIETKNSDVRKWKYPVGPRIVKILEKNKLQSNYWIPIYAGDLAFQVTGMFGDQYVVNLKEKKCACNLWSLSGVPCCHAIACIFSRGLEIFDFVHESLKRSTYEKIYAHLAKPINGPAMWVRTGKKFVEMPEFKRQRGRPKKKRNREADEIKLAGTNTLKLKRNYIGRKCSKCGMKGHNKSSCGMKKNSNSSSKAAEFQANGSAYKCQSTGGNGKQVVIG